MENHHFSWENSLFQWPFSMSQTVSLPEGTSGDPPYFAGESILFQGGERDSPWRSHPPWPHPGRPASVDPMAAAGLCAGGARPGFDEKWRLKTNKNVTYIYM